jgi:hypothetical protein
VAEACESADEWEGWPEPGTRVRVPHMWSTIEGEVISRYWTWITRQQVADVRVYLPVSIEPDEMRAVDVPFGLEALEVISEQPPDAGHALPK